MKFSKPTINVIACEGRGDDTVPMYHMDIYSSQVRDTALHGNVYVSNTEYAYLLNLDAVVAIIARDVPDYDQINILSILNMESQIGIAEHLKQRLEFGLDDRVAIADGSSNWLRSLNPGEKQRLSELLNQRVY